MICVFFVWGESERCGGKKRLITWRKSSFIFTSSQSQSYLIYSQSKVTAKLIYIQTLLFAIEFCDLWLPVLSPLQRMQNIKCIFVLCLSAVSSSFGLVSVMSELRLSI